MEELSRGIRDLHDQVKRLDGLLRQSNTERDLSEKLGAAAARKAESAEHVAHQARATTRLMFRFVVIGLLAWTPVVSYGAVWFHELVRNNCYPAVVLAEVHPPSSDPWYCTLFPGTGHDHWSHP